MDIKEKIVKAFVHRLGAQYTRLEDDDGISGFVVSPTFDGMSAFDRQVLIEEALSKGPEPLTRDELRAVLMIAALAPVEYDAVGAPIRVQRIREIAVAVGYASAYRAFSATPPTCTV